MIVLGVILLVVGYLLAIPILWTLGIILMVMGLILMLLGMAGHAIGGRRHYYWRSGFTPRGRRPGACEGRLLNAGNDEGAPGFGW
jgi:uncharacterized protein DUF6131